MPIPLDPPCLIMEVEQRYGTVLWLVSRHTTEDLYNVKEFISAFLYPSASLQLSESWHH
jgi:hypothetical protein